MRSLAEEYEDVSKVFSRLGWILVSMAVVAMPAFADTTTPAIVGTSATAAAPAAPSSPALEEFPVISRGEAVALDRHLDPGHAVLFEFFSQTCATCKAIAPALKILPDKYPYLEIRQIDIGDGDTPVVSQYNIEATPTFILYDGSGKQVQRLVTGDMSLVESAVQNALPTGTANAGQNETPQTYTTASTTPSASTATTANATPGGSSIANVDVGFGNPPSTSTTDQGQTASGGDRGNATDALGSQQEPEQVTNADLSASAHRAAHHAAHHRVSHHVAHRILRHAVAHRVVHHPEKMVKSRTRYRPHPWRFASLHVVPSGYTYVVRDHNTLFGIAVDALGKGSRWPEIAALNHLYPGEAIRLGTVLKLPR